MAMNYSAGETSSEDESDYLETQKLDLSYGNLDAEGLHTYIKEMNGNRGPGSERWEPRSV